jgi:photosystem II stability/assembly factor-like uncharacterized protein
MRRICAIAATALCALSAIFVGQAAAAPVSVGRSGWLWGAPLPQGETLNQVAFKGATGYAVGEGGTVLRSEDGGNDWVGLSSGTEANLSLLQEIEPGTIVVGGGCTVRESTDSGASFHRLPVSESELGCAGNSKVASLSFVSASTGYVERADGSILFTVDGGQTVQSKTPVPLDGGVAVQIDFLSASVGFAIVDGGEGGHIYRTADGASSWTLVALAPNREQFDSLTFVSPTEAYAVGGGAAVPYQSPVVYNGTVLLRSEDEGRTWHEQDTENASHLRSIELTKGSPTLGLGQIACSDPLHCLMTTGTSTLVATSDGGVTGSLVTPSEQKLLSVAFTTGSNAVAVGVGGVVVLSPDGGETFPTTISRDLGGEFSAQIRVGANAQDAYQAGRKGQIAATTDGGASWSVLQVPTSADLGDVAFPTTQVGYTVDSSGTVYRTANGGQSWAILSSVGEAPSRLLAPNANTVLLVGPNGLRRSTNGGQSFAAVGGSVVVGHRHHRAVERRLSALPLYAGAEQVGTALIAWGGEAIESTDGGAHWTSIPKPLAQGDVENLSFVSPTTGYESSRQRLFFTRNRGRSWSEISSLGIQPFGTEENVSFSSVADGYALGNYGGHRDVLLHTSDGARTWVPEVLPRPLEAVIADGAVDYAMGRGALFMTDDGGLDPNASSLTLAFDGSHRISRAKLNRSHGRVGLKGHLSPAQGGETVTISWRAVGRSVWTHRNVKVASNGSFALTASGISSSTDFVAQWTGEGLVAGDGTPALALTVTRR